MRTRMKIQVDVIDLYRDMISSGRRFVSVRDVSRKLCTNALSASRVLARLEEMGYARKWSRGIYILVDAETLVANQY
ncbi:hypothetical protein ACSU1N_03445 [Thermogladius sp. 4427co]|uniref:hypothetical protein n=1 Tax=Thermogladius sp. 4427co TaxID=3450718 RepID=UPI003F791B2B